MRERYRERGPSLALLLTFVLVAGSLNLAVGGLMQVVVTHGAGGVLPALGTSTKIELIDGVEIDRDGATDEDPVPQALIFLEEPMETLKPEDAEHSGEVDHDVEEETRAQPATDPGSARGMQTREGQPETADGVAGTQVTPRPKATPRPPTSGGVPQPDARPPLPTAKSSTPAPPEDPDGAQPLQPPGAPESPPAPELAVQGSTPQAPSPASNPAPAVMAPNRDSMRESMHEVFGGGGSHQAVEPGLSQGPRDDVKTVKRDHAGFFNRIRQQIVMHWDPNALLKGEPENTRAAIHRRTRTTQLRVRLRKDGRVDRIWIDRSSGFDLLDEHAIKAVRAGSPFANLPPGLQSPDDGKLVFSMEFRFTKGGTQVLRMGR